MKRHAHQKDNFVLAQKIECAFPVIADVETI